MGGLKLEEGKRREQCLEPGGGRRTESEFNDCGIARRFTALVLDVPSSKSNCSELRKAPP